jgi:tripartite-type tricarboxylate transporter receptor subunit TctC
MFYAHKSIAAIALALSSLALTAIPTSAQSTANASVASFYDGKQIGVLLGGVGGEFDLNMRLMSKYFPQHMPGSPRIVPQYMTGSGGLKRASYLYSVAPKDGTMLGLIPENFPALQALGGKGMEFDVRKFYWIGSFSPFNDTYLIWHTAGVRTFDDLKTREVISGATGRDSMSYIYPALINAFFGTKIKIIIGYEGGSTINAAMERGEVTARHNTWTSVQQTKPDWLADKKIFVVAQSGPAETGPAGVPILEKIAPTEDARQIIQLAISGGYLGRPLATNPSVPMERVTALRKAFTETLADPEFLAEAKKLKVAVDPIPGDRLQEMVAHVLDFPERLVPKAREIVQ